MCIILLLPREHISFLPIARLNKSNIESLEKSLQAQFENHFYPDEIEQLAKKNKFVQRKSKLDGFSFLTLVIFNTNSLLDESLNDLTIDLAQNHNIDISKQGLHERFNACSVKFMASSLEMLLNKQLFGKVSFRRCDEFKRFLIKDSVCFQIDESLTQYYPGSGGSGSKANVRIQFEYDLLNGQIIDLSLNAFNDQDAKNSAATLDLVESGDLIVRDLAYMHLEVLQGIVERLGHFLCRLNTQTKVYQEKNGKFMELNFARIVKAMRENNIQQVEELVWLGKEKDLQVRLFIFLMPQDVYSSRIRKAENNARKKGRQLTQEYKARSALNLLVTSASEELIDLDTAWKIYSLRWQIELTFKIWKSICKIDKVKKVKKDRLECYIWAKLLLIVLCWQITWFTAKLLKKYYGKNLSFFKAFKTLMHDMTRVENMLLGGSISPDKYLIDFLKISSAKHLLEQKSAHNYSPEILISSITVRLDGELDAL